MFFKESKINVAAIDIGTTSVKAVSVSNDNNNLMLNNYNELHAAAYVGKEIGEYVKMGYRDLENIILDSYSELKVKADKLIIGIPVSECIFRNISLPINIINITDAETLKSIIRLEFRKKLFGVDILNYSITFTEIKKTSIEIEYLVLAVSQDYISTINSICKKLEIEYVIEPNIFGGIRMLPQSIDKNVLLVNIGANNINLAFLNNGKLVGIENIEVGINKIIFNVKNSGLISYLEARDIVLSFDYDLQENSPVSDVIKLSTVNTINQIIYVLNNYELRYNVKYSDVYIGGSCAKIKNTESFYKANLKREVFVIKPFDRINLPVVLQENLTKDSSVFMNAVGLAINHVSQP